LIRRFVDHAVTGVVDNGRGVGVLVYLIFQPIKGVEDVFAR